MAKRRLIHLSLLLLLSSSFAWANDDVVEHVHDRRWPGGRGGVQVVERGGFEDRGPTREVIEVIERVVERIVGRGGNHLPSPVAAEKVSPAELAVAQITAPPSLRNRQDQGQIQALSAQLQQLSDRSRQVSDASRQISQQSQQLSQSLNQVLQQLSQTQTKLTSALSAQTAALAAQTSAESAAAAAQSAAQQAAAAASAASTNAAAAAAAATASANSAISAAITSASSSAAQAISAASSSILSSVVSSASVSVAAMNSAASSMVQQAQADASSVREQANGQVQQAQGAAVSVTQAALAVVGAIIGSSLLTIVAFALILRYRRIKQRQVEIASSSSRSNIGYPALVGTSANGSGYEPSAYEGQYGMPPKTAMTMNSNGYPVDVKEPVPILYRTNTNPSRPTTRDRNGGAVGGGGFGGPGAGVGVGGGGPGGGNGPGRGGGGPGGGIGYATSVYSPPAQVATTRPANAADEFQLRDPPPRKEKFSLFPNSMDDPGPPPQQPLPSVAGRTGNSTSPKQNNPRGSKGVPPSLDTWLKTSTVSPFGTLNRTLDKRETQWPMKEDEGRRK